MVYIGTTNPQKIENIGALLRLTNSRLSYHDIIGLHITPPSETGANESERAQQKADYYFSHVHKPVISEDDGIYFDQKVPAATGIHFADTNRATLERPLDFWKDIFKKNAVVSGTLHKAYAVVTERFKNTCTATIPFTITDPATDVRNQNNVLNYFLVPKGFTSPIATMTDAERLNFRKQFLLEPVRNLLRQSGLLENTL